MNPLRCHINPLRCHRNPLRCHSNPLRYHSTNFVDLTTDFVVLAARARRIRRHRTTHRSTSTTMTQRNTSAAMTKTMTGLTGKVDRYKVGEHCWCSTVCDVSPSADRLVISFFDISFKGKSLPEETKAITTSSTTKVRSFFFITWWRCVKPSGWEIFLATVAMAIHLVVQTKYLRFLKMSSRSPKVRPLKKTCWRRLGI